MNVATKKPRFQITLTEEIHKWVLEQADLLGIHRTQFVERVVTEKKERSPHEIVVSLDPEILEKLKELAVNEERTLESQIIWILRRWVDGDRRGQ